MNVSEYILATFRANGIDAAFGLPGVHALGLWKALRDSNMRYIGFRHEQAAAHAADGYGRAKRVPGVVLLSTGPGALNTLSALAEANVSSSPVIAVSSAIPTRYLGKQKGFLHETKDLAPAFEAVTRFHGRATSPDQVPELMEHAFIAANGSRPGSVLIEIPADVFDMQIDAEPGVISASEPSIDSQAIEDAALLLRLAARPVIWAGGGVLRSAASDELVRVAELIGAPVVTTFMGKGAIPENHPLSIGALVRQPEVATLLGEADALLAVGTRFSGMATGNWKLALPEQIVHIDIDPDEIGRNYPVRNGIVADAKKALEALAGAIQSPVRDADWAARVGPIRSAARDRADGYEWESSVLGAVREAVPPDTTTVHDMTVPSYWAAPFFPVNTPGTYHYPYGYASLGFSFPAAIGVTTASNTPVVAFSGDGGFQYHSRELATLAQYGLPVTVIVFNDESWGVLRAFSKARYGEEFGLDLPSPDLIALSASYGVKAERVTRPAEIKRAVAEAVASGEPRLIEVPGRWELPPPSDYYR